MMEELLAFSPPPYIKYPQLTLPLETDFFLYRHELDKNRDIMTTLNEHLTPFQREENWRICKRMVEPTMFESYTTQRLYFPFKVALLQDYFDNPRLIDWSLLQHLMTIIGEPYPIELVDFFQECSDIRTNHFYLCEKIKKERLAQLIRGQ